MMSFLLHPGDTVAFIACSDGLSDDEAPQIGALTQQFAVWGVDVKLATTLLRHADGFSGSAHERASELMRLYADPDVKAIFDISGGDSANQILPDLDFAVIRNCAKPFFGLSDLTVVLNALHTMAGLTSYHYQARCLVWENRTDQAKRFHDTFFRGGRGLLVDDYRWLRGQSMDGILVGGNIRCFLKLAGTPYLPQPEGKVLLLESLGGAPNRIAPLVAQLQQIGYLARVNGVILGTFSELERLGLSQAAEKMILDATASTGTPIMRTGLLGHMNTARCCAIGDRLNISRG
jgi:muramoyltetrapeptide carboxypeptidase LdcA involved in peptidoglycan recycling